MSNQRPILIIAGGTGGHVYPALAVADDLRQRGWPVIWLGTRQGIESRLVPPTGIPIEWLPVAGLRGKRLLQRLAGIPRLFMSLIQAARVMARCRPVAVLGMGGFVTGPGGLMARLFGVPLCIHEQNSVAGLTNRLLGRIANQVLEAFPDSFPDNSRARKKAVLTGNPVRTDISEIEAPAERLAARCDVLRLLVVGGSLGAQQLNQTVPQALAQLAIRIEVRHQTGPDKLEQTQAMYKQAGVKGDVRAYLDDMCEAYSWADIVLCRAGAITVAELANAGLASILVPYPHAVDDHQTGNAAWLCNNGAAEMIADSSLNADWLAGRLQLYADDRKKILQMAVNARVLARPDAARRVADICLHSFGAEGAGPEAGHD
ncbi:MAG TPA: undecaprenyldiphospho-muramoylpentapeptide beta-N-acetylglucosaminyltransferase [Gammaproteobacteria bacterium]|nr:undecaprenyldiphospho-muramoylpentapeptide beta-N-acetylglucosaminyltransferase [Gammaproteobacteria bacterium]